MIIFIIVIIILSLAKLSRVCECACVRACMRVRAHVGVCIQDLHCFKQSFSHITTASDYQRELNANFYSAVSMMYHAPDTWHETNPSHIILTPWQ